MERMSIGKSKSLNFYKYLCQKIGTEEAVRFRRLAFITRDIGQRKILITSGSRGEGLDLKGSDIDLMIVETQFKVYESEKEVQSKHFAIPLIMKTEDTQPGYTQLWLLNQKMIFGVNVLQCNHLGYNVLSSQLYKLLIKDKTELKDNMVYSGKIHGPCLSDQEDTMDLAFCLKCDKWISEAKPWFSRPRTTWPSTQSISKIVSSGVLLVPIGCKGSINEHLEWRISFSVAEKFLIFSFSHTQLLCYAMLKILLKEIVEKHEDLKGMLCSYFLKTVMFWILEETDRCRWRPDNIIPCFMLCLQRLMYCVKYSILLHYFMPDNNFFSKFNIINKEKLITLLKNLYEQGMNCFAASETLRDYQSYSHKITESVISRNFGLLRQLIPTFSDITGVEKNFPSLLFAFLHNSRIGSSRVLLAIQISSAFLITAGPTKYENSVGNKNHYIRYKHDLSHLMIGLHSDAVSGLLMLASFFYVKKNYISSLTVIEYTLKKCTAENIDLADYILDNIKLHEQHVMQLVENEKLYTILKSLTVYSLRLWPHSSIVPKELKQDVQRCPQFATFHPLPYLHFLSFLCHYHRHDNTSSRRSLQQLIHVEWIKSNGHTCFQIPTSLNSLIMCGIAHQFLGETNPARKNFEFAAKLDDLNTTSAASRLFRLI